MSPNLAAKLDMTWVSQGVGSIGEDVLGMCGPMFGAYLNNAIPY